MPKYKDMVIAIKNYFDIRWIKIYLEMVYFHYAIRDILHLYQNNVLSGFLRNQFFFSLTKYQIFFFK